jgi:succinylarginine dihydrolase
MAAHIRQFSFDGIPGPTHRHSGLAHGNVQSAQSSSLPSHPRLACLQRLRKARQMQDAGIAQALFPPLVRPYLSLLVTTGFIDASSVEQAWQSGNFDYVAAEIERIAQNDPELVGACFAASGMWVANWATVTPSSDSLDGRLHFTPANLASNLHRSLEAAEVKGILEGIFGDRRLFCVHAPLAANVAVTDEGAANHMRLCHADGGAGIHIFVYGEHGIRRPQQPQGYVGRQTRMASRALAVRNNVPPGRWTTLQQSELAIAQGVFHNDVIAMNHHSGIVCHELAYAHQERSRNDVLNWAAAHGIELRWLEIPDRVLPIAEAVRTFFFNSQIATAQSGENTLICEAKCETSEPVCRVIAMLRDEGLVDRVLFVDLTETLRSGGGPACGRLRIELGAAEQAVLCGYRGFDPAATTWNQLEAIVRSTYPDQWTPGERVCGAALRGFYEAIGQIRNCLGLSEPPVAADASDWTRLAAT